MAGFRTQVNSKSIADDSVSAEDLAGSISPSIAIFDTVLDDESILVVGDAQQMLRVESYCIDSELILDGDLYIL